ncbi:MAG: carboxypeptidase regulatory-like domain-containing protein [Bacteroidales bacterium]|nr:carboxypeptidase regulatory-like domain-containing protein [Bacteroidales bacterium]
MRTTALLFALVMWGTSMLFGQVNTETNHQQKSQKQELPELLSPNGDPIQEAGFNKENLKLYWEPTQGNRNDHFYEGYCNCACTMWGIFISGATINGNDLVADDEIGVFDGDVLVGEFDLTQVCTPENQFENDLWALTVKCNGEPGYSEGNPVSFRAWDDSEATEYVEFQATYYNPYGDAWDDPFFPPGDGQYSIVSLAFTSGNPTGTLAGTVKNIENNEPIEGVIVDIGYANLTDTTDAAGSFEIDSIPPGIYSVSLSHPFFISPPPSSIEIIAGQTTIMDAFMEPKSPELLEAIPGPEQVTLNWQPVNAGIENYYQFEYGGNYNYWTIYFEEATMNGADMVAGDQIGIFDEDLLVGTLTLTQVCTPENAFDNELMAYGALDPPQGIGGYTPGNPVFFRAYDKSLGIEADEFEISFSDPYGDAWTEALFPEGDGQYSLVSLEFTKDYTPTFNVYYEDGTLIEGPVEGTSYTDTGLDPGTAYCYYVTQILENGMESGSSNIECATVLPPTYGVVEGTVTNEETSGPVEGATVEILEEDFITTTDSSGHYMIDSLETGIYQIEASYHGFVSSTQDMGINVGDTTVVDFALAVKSPSLLEAVPGTEEITLTWQAIGAGDLDHWEFEYGNGGYESWSIFIAHASINGEDMVEGDELGVFDGDLLVGAFDLTQVCTPENQFENTLLAVDMIGPGEPGYTPGNQATFKAWDQSNGIEVAEYEINFLDPYGDAWTEPIFPEDDGEYSLVTMEYIADYIPSFNIYYEDGTLVEEAVEGSTYTDTQLTPGTEYCYYVKQNLGNGMISNPSGVACATPLPQQPGIIVGTVTDSVTSEPIAGALVGIVGAAFAVSTDENGEYIIDFAPPGIWDFWCEADGYDPGLVPEVEVEAGDTITVNFTLEPEYMAPTLFPIEPGVGVFNLSWEPIGGGRTGYWYVHPNGAPPSYTIFIAGATINEEDMVIGDELGCFDDDVLVGYFCLDQVCTHENQMENDLVAWTELTTGPGYTPGHEVIFKGFDDSEYTVYEGVNVTYLDPYGDAWTEPYFPEGDGTYSIVELDFTDLSYEPSFNIYKMDEGLIAENVYGTTYTDSIEYPYGEHCYYITQLLENGTESDSSNIECAVLPPPFGTLMGTVTDAITNEPLEGVQVTIDSLQMTAITGEDGSYMIEDVPIGTYAVTAVGSYSYEIQTQTGVEILPGETTVLDFALEPINPAPTLLSATPGPGSVALTWQPIGGKRVGYWEVYGQGGDPVWTIYIYEALINEEDMIPGDEVGVFDGNLLVGGFTLDQICTPENQFENDLLAWSTLINGDGYTPGNPVIFKAYQEETGSIYNSIGVNYADPYGDAWTQPVFPEGDGQYSLVGLSFGGDPYEPTFNVYYADGTLVAENLQGTMYTDTGLEGGQEYCYYIRQMMENGTLSDSSNIECATPTEIVAPELTHIEREVQALTLVWEPYLENSRINHFDFVGGTGGPIWTIFLAHASIDDADMVAGDEVAVFDGDLMVGAFTLTQVCTPENQYENDMPAFSELTTGDGYTPGNAASFKGWDESEMMEVSQFNLNFLDPNGDAWVEPVFPPSDGPYSIIELEFSASQYDPTYNVFYADGTQIAEGIEAISYTDENLEGGEEYCYYVTQIFESGEESEPSNVLCEIPYGNQTIPLEDNYSFVSSYIVPFNPDLMDLLPDVLDNLDMVRSQSGNTLQKIGPNWVNNIGDWVSTQGYLFHMDAPDTLIMEGEVIAPTTPINLEYGYSFAGYLPKTGMNAMNAFETIIGDSLELIRNDNGNSIQKVGPNWINNIGDALPGEGYLVRMIGSGELVYPGNTKGYQPGKSLPSANSIGNPADPVYSIYIDPGKGIEAGDRILALEGDKVVGSVEITSGNWETNELPAFSTLIDGKGYQPGHPIKLAMERNGKLIELNHRLKTIHNAYTGNTYPEGDGIYSIAKVSMSITGQEEKDHQVNIFPNPASDKVYISSSKSMNSVKLYHASGKALIFEDGLNTQRYELDVSLFNPGTYILEIENGGSRIRAKLVVQ